jgi:hypothetical protein
VEVERDPGIEGAVVVPVDAAAAGDDSLTDLRDPPQSPERRERVARPPV